MLQHSMKKVLNEESFSLQMCTDARSRTPGNLHQTLQRLDTELRSRSSEAHGRNDLSSGADWGRNATNSELLLFVVHRVSFLAHLGEVCHKTLERMNRVSRMAGKSMIFQQFRQRLFWLIGQQRLAKSCAMKLRALADICIELDEAWPVDLLDKNNLVLFQNAEMRCQPTLLNAPVHWG